MKKIYMFVASLLLATASAVQADGLLVEIGALGIYSGKVGSQSTDGTDEVWKTGSSMSAITVGGSGECLTCSDFDVTASVTAKEDIGNTGQSTSDQSDVQTSSVGEGMTAVGGLIQVGDDYSRAAEVDSQYLNTTAGKYLGTSGDVTSNQWGEAGSSMDMNYTGSACPSGDCTGETSGETNMNLTGYVNTGSSTTVHAVGEGGDGALAVNAGLLVNKIQIVNGQLSAPTTTTAP